MVKCKAFCVAVLLLMASAAAASAQETLKGHEVPTLHIFTDRGFYEGGERGYVVLVIDTYGQVERAGIEVEVLSESGAVVEGDLLYTNIPQAVIVNPQTKQTMQKMYEESITYFGPQVTVYRFVEFEVPLDAKTGDYTITGRVFSSEIALEEETMIHVTGPGGFMDIIFLLYIAVLLVSFYLLRRN
jgi:hypothetical protein